MSVDFEKKEIHFTEGLGIHELATYLTDTYPEERWRDYKIVIDGRTDEKEDT